MKKTRFRNIGQNFLFSGGTFSYENIECGDNVFIGAGHISFK